MHTHVKLSRRSRGDETQISPVHPPDGIVSLVTSPATISSSRRTLHRTCQKTAEENVDLTSLHPRIPAISRESKKNSRPSRPWRASREVPSASTFDFREFGFRGKTRNPDYPAQDRCTFKNEKTLAPYTDFIHTILCIHTQRNLTIFQCKSVSRSNSERFYPKSSQYFIHKLPAACHRGTPRNLPPRIWFPPRRVPDTLN
jgi:hypothetical protein